MVKEMHNLVEACKVATKRFFAENYAYRASALAFTSLLAIVPFFSVIFFIIAKSPLLVKIITLAENYIYSHFIPTSGQVIQFYLDGFVQKANTLPALGILFLLVTVGLLILTIAQTLNVIWRAHVQRRNLIEWLIYWIVLIFAPLLIGLTVLLSTYFFSIAWFAHTVTKLGFQGTLLALVSLLINTLMFSVLYIVAPNRPINWRDGLYGGLVAAILFEFAKKGFVFYINHFPSYEIIYGVMAAMPIFLVWLYISWVIVLFGALVAYAHYQQRHKKP